MATVLVCGETSRVRDIVRNHLRDFDIRHAMGLDTVAGGGASCIVACYEAVTAAELAVVDRLMRTHPVAKVLLVTRLSTDALHALADAPELSKHVVPAGDVAALLPEQVRASLDRHVLERAAETLETLRDVPSAVKAFVRRVWARRRPPVTVARAAEEIPFSETILREGWAAAGFRPPLKDSVDWALLLRAADAHRSGLSWERSAYMVSVTKARLQRITHRLLEADLRDIDEHGSEWLEACFADWLVASLPADPVEQRSNSP